MDLEEQYDKIYRYCYFKIRNRETAEDITQEAFLRLFQSHPEMRKEEALRFLYTVAHNLCVDEYRKRHSLPLAEDEADPCGMEDEILDREAVRTALLKLDPADRELLLLKYVNEVPVAVMGSLMGLSRFSVRRKIIQAVKRFKRYLG